ncbi:MAG: FHA domain-containing protein [Gammaproteobacteria bacterium]|nr:FHA domain-containing protein [Gammaproteobacteria bacterium]
MQEETRKFAQQSHLGTAGGTVRGTGGQRPPRALLRCQDLSKLKGPTGAEIRLHDSDVLVGRTEDNDAVVKGEGVSRKHARIAVENGAWAIIDLESTNGVRVNGSRITRQVLKNGDSVTLGRVVYTYEVLDPPDSADVPVPPPEFERTVVMGTRPVMADNGTPSPPAAPSFRPDATAIMPQRGMAESQASRAKPQAVQSTANRAASAASARKATTTHSTPDRQGNKALWVLVLLVALGIAIGGFYLFTGRFVP